MVCAIRSSHEPFGVLINQNNSILLKNMARENIFLLFCSRCIWTVKEKYILKHGFTAVTMECMFSEYSCLLLLFMLVIMSSLLVGCLTSRQHASVSQGRICSDSCTCCHTEIEAADQTFHLTQSQYTDTGPTSPITDPITPGAWQRSHWSVNV